jgi:hypothetical protein
VAIEIGRKIIRQRQDTYLTDHYLATHSTAVNVALGVAGISAVSLLSPTAGLHSYQHLFWLLWLISLLTTATAYSAAITGAIILPLRLPAVVDLLLPLLLSMSEFMLFGVLATQVTGFSSAATILAGWWFTMSAYSLIAFLQVRRACYLIAGASYSPELRPAVARYLKRQRWDMAVLGAVVALAALIGSYHALFGVVRSTFFMRQPPVLISLILTLPIALISGPALVGIDRTARELRTALARVNASDS